MRCCIGLRVEGWAGSVGVRTDPSKRGATSHLVVFSTSIKGQRQRILSVPDQKGRQQSPFRPGYPDPFSPFDVLGEYPRALFGEYPMGIYPIAALLPTPRQDFRTAVGGLRLAVRMDKSELHVRQRLAEVLLSQASDEDRENRRGKKRRCRSDSTTFRSHCFRACLGELEQIERSGRVRSSMWRRGWGEARLRILCITGTRKPLRMRTRVASTNFRFFSPKRTGRRKA